MHLFSNPGSDMRNVDVYKFPSKYVNDGRHNPPKMNLTLGISGRGKQKYFPWLVRVRFLPRCHRGFVRSGFEPDVARKTVNLTVIDF